MLENELPTKSSESERQELKEQLNSARNKLKRTINPDGLISPTIAPGQLRTVKPVDRFEDERSSFDETVSSARVIDADIFYTEFGQLQELVTIASNRCSTCSAPLQIVSQNGSGFTREGLCICLELGCSTGRHAKMHWKSSPYSAAGCLIVNRLVCSAFFLCGIERNDFLEPHIACGMPISERSYHRYIDNLEELIQQAEDTSYQAARSIANVASEPADVAIDGQWCNPQKSGRVARQCTNTTIVGTPGIPNVVIDQVHVTVNSLEANGLPASRSKDVEGIRRAAANLSDILVNVGSVTIDPCSSGPKAVRELVKPAFPECKTFLCAWHEENNIKKDFKRKFIDARSVLAKTQGNRKYEPTYPDVATLGISMQDIRNHCRFCVETSQGDLDLCKQLWLSAPSYFTRRAGKQLEDLQPKFVADFEAWLEKHAESFAFIIEGFRTDHVESFHHFVTARYVRKGAHHSDKVYKMRRALAACHWNEIQMGKYYDELNSSNECVGFRRDILRAVNKQL